MAKKKQPTQHELFAQSFVETFDPKSIGDVEDSLKLLFGPIFESMLNAEMEAHLGYKANERAPEDVSNRRNGTTPKTLKSSIGEIPIESPRDRDGTFTPEIIPKRTTDISAIESKILTMYGKGMSQRDIADIIEDIYGFRLSAEKISIVTDSVLEELTSWQERPLDAFYPFMFVDCFYTHIRNEHESKKHAVYVIVALDINGKKDILGLWIDETEGKTKWLNIFDELKCRGVQDVGFISMDGLSGLEEGCGAIFPNAIVQRCIVHLVRNSIKYIPSKHYKEFTANLKKIYTAPNAKVALLEFEKFKERWSAYNGAVAVWEKNWHHVEQLFDYTAAVRKIMYTTNMIESINSSFRKVTRKGVFPTETALMKVLFLRILELYEKWMDRPYSNWSTVRNQLLLTEGIGERFAYYDQFN